jgi:ABC-2 type transport system ATP-binding protein
VDRPRRALFEEPDNVESYVAKRSRGFTQADSGDHIVVRPARAVRALEPRAVGTEAQTADRDDLGFSDPPRPRRASPAEPLSWDLEEQKAIPTEAAAAGRPAIVDLEPTPSRRPVVPSQPILPAAMGSAAPEPRSVASSPEQTPRPVRPTSGQTVDRAAAPAVHRARRGRWAVRHEVPPIVVDRLIKSYNGTLAVHNLSFVAEPGRVTGFLGPNGAGKTTTMRILLGLVAPTTGTATFGELAYADLPYPQRTVGCVLDARFHPGRSGRNHLRVLAPTAGANDRRVDELLGGVGLGDVARQPVGEYSMGMQQRLALAAALLGNPDYLILDEPANGLDPEGIRWLRTFLRDFAASGRAVFVSSHLLNEIEATADDIVVINRGRLLAQLPMSELNLGEGMTRARVSDVAAAVRVLASVGADVETVADERGAYLRIHSHDVGQVGSALFSSGIAVDELSTERRDLEQEFFSMLEGSG